MTKHNSTGKVDTLRAVVLATLVVVSMAAVAVPAQAASTTDVSLDPTTNTLAPGETTTVDIVVENVDGGIGSIDATVTTNNSGVARITDLSVKGSPTLQDNSVNNTTAHLKAIEPSTENSGSVTIATVTIEAGDTGAADLSLSVNAIADNDAQKYEIGATNGTSINIEEQDERTTDVRLTPETTEVQAGSTQSFDVVVDSATNGVGAIDMSLSLSNSNAAEITSVTIAGEPAGTNTSIAGDGSTANIQAFGMDTSDSGSVTVATITVRGETAEEQTGLSLAVDGLATEPGQSYTVAATSGSTLSVTGEQGGGGGAGETTVTIALDGAPNGLQQYSVNVSAPSDVTITNVEPAIIEGGFQVKSGGEGSSYTVARAADISGVVGSFDDQKDLFTVTFEGDVNKGDVDVTVLELLDDEGNSMDDSRITIAVEQPTPFDAPIGGGVAPPQDPDGDGLYEDINGDGEATFQDAVAIAFINGDDLSNEQVAALDFNGDGDVNFDDAISLAFSV